MSDSEKDSVHSVQVTVQRTKIEYGFVSVLLSSDMLDEDGQLDVDRIMQLAAKAGHSPEVEWHEESQSIDINPIQKPRKQEKVYSVDGNGKKLDL